MKIVYTYVCGDIIHRGHVSYLLNAKKFGDVLIVGVLTDNAIIEKKKCPTLSFDERMFIVGALKSVDVVIPQNTYSPISNMHILHPDIMIESESHNIKDIAEVSAHIENLGGRIIILPYYLEQSSTGIKNKIKEDTI